MSSILCKWGIHLGKIWVKKKKKEKKIQEMSINKLVNMTSGEKS